MVSLAGEARAFFRLRLIFGSQASATRPRAKVFRSVLGLQDFLQKYLCMPFKIAKSARYNVQSAVGYILIIEIIRMCVRYSV
jgi:hypothetical protein